MKNSHIWHFLYVLHGLHGADQEKNMCAPKNRIAHTLKVAKNIKNYKKNAFFCMFCMFCMDCMVQTGKKTCGHNSYGPYVLFET